MNKNQATGAVNIAAREQDDAATLLRKYKKLCIEIGRGDGYHLDRIERAISALESERQAHAAEVERLKGDAERWNAWLPWLRRLNKKPFNLAKEIDAIDQAIARGTK